MKKIRRYGFVFLSFVVLSFGFKNVSCNGKEGKQQNARNDSWRVIGPGGGGAMFNPSVSPHDPDFAFVSCDMGGSYVTYNGGKSWRMFNLHDMVRSFVFDPVHPDIIYANSLGLYKSADKGNTWELIYPNPAEINGLISKGDHASEKLWTRDNTNRRVLALAVDPVVPEKLYAAISVDGAILFCISNDGGKQWKTERELDRAVKDIFIDPSSPIENRTLYLTTAKGIIRKVNNEWSKQNTPLGVTTLTSFSGGYDSQTKKIIIYSISGKSYFQPDNEISGIYFTDNGGLTWENRQAGLLKFNLKPDELPEWRTIATCASQPDVVYVSYNQLNILNDTICNGVAKSTDYGKTWQLVWTDKYKQDNYIATKNLGKDWLNERFGPGWGENPFCIAVSPTNPSVCFATDFGRTTKTTDGGKNWEQLNSRYNNPDGWASTGLDVTTAYTIVFDPFDSDHVFIPATDIGLMESRDGTTSWMSATKDNGIPENWVNTTYWLTFDKDVPGKAWAVMSQNHDLPRPKMFRKRGVSYFSGGIVMTENGGKNWQPVSAPVGEAAMTHIIYDPESNKEMRTLYACAFGKGVYKSVDGGKTWSRKNKGIAGDEPFAWQITRRDTDGALFLVVSRRSDDGSIGDDRDGAIYKSVDGAENWIKISLPEGTNAPTTIVVDKNNPEKLILSAWGRVAPGPFTPDTGGGIFISEDEGKTWEQAMGHDQHIGAITFDDRNNRYYACGFNGSAYYSEDGAITWGRIKGYNFKWGQRVEPDPHDPEMIYIITYGGGVWHGPAKGDKTATEDIVTRLDRLN